MNSIMVVEIIVFGVLLLAGLFVMLFLRHKLKQYDGMGEVKKGEIGETGDIGENKPPKAVL